ncbi:putative Ig domain-containing protein [Hydrogenophaga sp. A37]|uniref:beta strand repeat-containing protein n=1 Tax=Hydrogenophaga sp. A37 TaxID=1945864 RepID=UPI0015C56837|nr:putative Ig domain-containing protein [Hydrogenophaga sp. A37]
MPAGTLNLGVFLCLRRLRTWTLLQARWIWLSMALCLPGLAMAQVSPYCPAQNLTVANGGSVTSIDLAACDGPFNFGMGGPFAPFLPVNGSVDLGPQSGGGNQTVSYTHNGTATTTDTFALEDENGDELFFNVTITPAASAIVVSPASLPTLTAGTPFSQTLTSAGGVAPYTYTLQSGTLPVGLSLSGAGVLSGTPTQRGSYTFTVRSTDSVSDFVDKGYTGTVQNPSLALATSSGTAIQSAPFSQTLSTTGGVAPYSYLLETGTFPAGITISSAGVVSGTTAAAPGNYPVTLRVTDASTGPGSYFELEAFTLTVSPPPTVSIAVSPASVSEDGATNLVYTITRSLNLSSATVVNITTGGTATSGVDYIGGVATVSIPAGATTATITINPTVDGTVEANETVILTVDAGTGYTVGAPASATGTILNDDVPSATISVAPASVSEDGATNLVYTVTLTQAPLVATSVNFTVAGTATSGTDYAAVTSPLVISAGSTTGTITVNPTADATIETDETVILTLAAGAGYTVGAPASATGTILNDDLPTLTINDVTAAEGNAGTTNFTFTVSLSTPAGPGGVTFDIATANGTATAGVDYVANSLTGQTIPAGSSTYSFTVLVNGDTLNEPSETFFVNVTNVTNAVVGDAQGLGTIVNDDPLPSLSIDDVTVVEGNSGTTSAVFTVTLSAASGQTVSVNYATADGTATQSADYTSTSGTLTFTPGQTTQTITVLVAGETVPEAGETFFVNLSGATNATIADNQGLGTITNDDVPVTVNPATVPSGAVAAAYSQTLTASGGVAPYSFAVTAGALPAGLTLSAGGVLSGTPTAGGTFNFTATATDSSPFPGPFAGSRAYTLVVTAPTIVLPATSLAGGTVGTAYSASITAASGGTAPYSYAVTAGALPSGLTLSAPSGAITGTPSATGTFNFSITAIDSSTGTGPYTATQSYAITVIDLPPIANASSLTVAYNAAATPVTLNITGGTPTSVAIGTAPAHGTAIASGTSITYQPTTGYAGPDSFTYTATNTGGTSAPATVTVTVSDPVITATASGSFSATVGTPYAQTITLIGGAPPWSGFIVTNLPAGLSITGTTPNSVTVSGTPTQAGIFTLNASATDSSTGNGPYTVGDVYVLTVAAPGLALTPAATTFSAPYAVPYSQSFTASGGTGPYSYAMTAGTLPAGVSFSGNTVSGTPTAPGSYNFTITATDTGSSGTGAPFSIAQSYTLTVAAPTIAVSPTTLPNPAVGTPYSQTVTASGGIAPYSFVVSAGSLPAGLTLSTGGVLSGTTNQVGTFNLTVTATDANAQTGSRAYTVTIGAPTLTLAPAAGALTAPYGVVYSQSFVASGGSGSFSYGLTGALPAGLTFSGNTVSGTPTVPGSYPVTVTATDTLATGAGAPFSVAQNYTINVAAPTLVVNPASLPNPAVGTAYSQTITASGGVAPYSFALTAGALPAGMTLGTGGALTGTPTQVGSFSFTVTVTDNFSQVGSRAYTLVVGAPTLTMTPAAGVLTAPYGVAYSQVFTASGSPGPYTYALTGALPTGVTFSGNTLSGTPTAPGSYPITVTATDSALTGAGAPFSVAQNHVLNVAAPTFAVTPTTLPDPVAGEAYSQLLTASGGVAPYTFALTSGSLPTGLSLSASGLLSGTATQVGTFNISVTVTDANGQLAVFNFEVRSTGSPRQTLTKQVLSNADEDRNGKVSLHDTLTYRITLSNAGFVPLSDVVVSDARIAPGSITCATVLPGQSCVLQGTYTVTAADARARRVVNVATVSSARCAAGSQDAQCRVTLSTQVIPAVVRAKNDDFGEIMCPKADAIVGNAYKNDTIDGQPIRAAEVLGSVVSAAKPTKPGKPVPELNTATGDVKVPAGTPGGSYSITYKICQRSVSNNCDTATIVVKIKQCQILVRVIKTANVKQTRVGDFVSYTLQIDNLSENDTEVEGLQIVDTPPPGFSLVSGSARFQDRNASGTVAGTGPITLDQIDLAGNGKAFITYVLRVGANARRGDAVNTAVPLHEGAQVGSTAKAVVSVSADPDTDETSIIGRVFIDRDGDGWQDSADAHDVKIQGGIDASVYVAGSTTVDRGQGAQPEPDASAPLLHGIRIGTLRGRGDADPATPLSRVVISQWLTAPVWVGDSVITSGQGTRITVKPGGEVVYGHEGDVAAGLNGQDLRVERTVTPVDGKHRVDYILTNRGVSELGLPGVRLASPEGLVVQTDSYGRFHIEGIDAAARMRGRNFVLKLDPVSLPQGARVTTENPLVRRLTGGLMVRFDFGVGFDNAAPAAVVVPPPPPAPGAPAPTPSR